MTFTLIIYSIVGALIAWFATMLVGTNLVGLVGRGIWEQPLTMDNDFINKEVKKANDTRTYLKNNPLSLSDLFRLQGRKISSK